MKLPDIDVKGLSRDELEALYQENEAYINRLHELMDVIPECSAHGQYCIPHAQDWIKASIKIRKAAANLVVFSEAYLDDQRNLDLFEADLINGSVTQAIFEEEVKKAKQIIM